MNGYVYAFAAILSFGSGFSAAHWVYSSRIDTLEHAIEQSNRNAAETLMVAKRKVEDAENEASTNNQALEVANSQSLGTINALHYQLTERLHDRKPSRENTVPTCASAGTIDEPAAPTDLSTRVINLAYRADQLAVYAQSCWDFVNNNCGVSNGRKY